MRSVGISLISSNDGDDSYGHEVLTEIVEAMTIGVSENVGAEAGELAGANAGTGTGAVAGAGIMCDVMRRQPGARWWRRTCRRRLH